MLKTIQLLLLGYVFLSLSSCIGIAATIGVLGVSKVASIQKDRRSAGTIVDDETLQIFLANWINNNPIANGGHINFLVYNRAVLLSGEVTDAKTKKAVEQAMLKERPDIVFAINELALRPNSKITERLKDLQIKVIIEALFYNQDVFYPGHVHLNVERGIVYLMGSLTKREANKVIKQVKKAKGVKRIIKYFNYLKQTPKAEKEGAKKQQQQQVYRIEQEKKRQELETQRHKIQQQLDELEGNAF